MKNVIMLLVSISFLGGMVSQNELLQTAAEASSMGNLVPCRQTDVWFRPIFDSGKTIEVSPVSFDLQTHRVIEELGLITFEPQFLTVEEFRVVHLGVVEVSCLADGVQTSEPRDVTVIVALHWASHHITNIVELPLLSITIAPDISNGPAMHRSNARGYELPVFITRRGPGIAYLEHIDLGSVMSIERDLREFPVIPGVEVEVHVPVPYINVFTSRQ